MDERGPLFSDGVMGVEPARAVELALNDGGIIHHITNARGKSRGIAVGKNGFFMADDFGDGPAAGAESGNAAGHGFDEDMAELFLPAELHRAHRFAGKHEDIEAAQERGDFEMRTCGQQVQPGAGILLFLEPGVESARTENGEVNVLQGLAGLKQFVEAFFFGQSAAVANDESVCR